MKRILFVFLFVLEASCSGGNAPTGKPPIEVAKNHIPKRGKFQAAEDYIMITSLVDKIVIQDVVINRDNCMYHKPDLPSELGFGEKLSVGFLCDAIEVHVTTNAGSYAFKW